MLVAGHGRAEGLLVLFRVSNLLPSSSHRLTLHAQLLFQEFARLAGAAEEVKDTALDTEEEIIKDAASPEDGDVNEAPPDNFEEVLTELQDPRVDYRRAVRCLS